MSSAAERARQKAEARRQRILSKSADRLGVVTGIVAPSILKGDAAGGAGENAVSSSSSPTSTTTLTNEAAAAAAIITPEPDSSSVVATTTMRENTNEEDRDDTDQISPRSDGDASVLSSSSGVVTVTAITATDNSSSSSAENESTRGVRRMAAMRKRRYQSKTKVVEEEEENNVVVVVVDTEVTNTHGEDSTTTALAKSTLSSNQMESKESNKLFDEQPLLDPTLTNEDAAGVSSKQMKHPQPSVITTDSLKGTDVIPTIDEKKGDLHDDDDDDNNNDNDEDHHNPKKYMGVARIRRQKVKEQRSQRLQAISDADVLGSSPSRSFNAGIDLVRELSAEVATMDITASMVRKGGMVAVLDDKTIGKWASARGLFANSKRRSWKWYSVVLPPMTVVPRLITLMLLFLAGLDLGTQPYRPSSSASYFGYGVDRDLTSAAVLGTTGSGLIGHVQHSLTKPWEYGMGGKVAYTVGMTSTSPPTALPTSFLPADNEDDDDITILMECASSDSSAECVAPDNDFHSDDHVTATNTGTKEKNRNKSAVKKKNNIKLQLMEDEFDSTRTRPRGVVNQHHHDAASEFDDVGLTASTYNNIDPLFQVDLDALLHNAHLPLPIDYAAKFAIGFHRTWVHYLWKLPTSLVKTIFGIPMNLLSGWIANPPWILGVVLLIRFVTKVLVGTSSGKSFSLGSENNEDATGSSSGLGGGSGGGNLDVMEKIMGAAKNYASSSFPRTSLVFGTLMQVMKVDMYVLLCGMLIGLVMSSMDEKMIGGGNNGDAVVGGGRSGIVLGGGEL